MHPGASWLGLFLLDLHAMREGLAAAWTLRRCGLCLSYPLRQFVQLALQLLADLGGRERLRGLLGLAFLRLRLLDPGEQFQQAVGDAQERCRRR